MSSACFRVSPRQRDIDTASLVDLKALADCFDRAHRLEEATKPARVNPKYLDVDVFGRALEQPIPYPAADDERTSACIANGRRYRTRFFEL